MAKITRRALVIGGAAFTGCLQTLRALGLEFLPFATERGARGKTSDEASLTQTRDQDVERRVNDLLSRMTLDEKVRQLCSLKIGATVNRFTDLGTYTAETVKEYYGATGIGSISLPIADMDAKAGTEVTNVIQRVAVDETRLGIPPLVDGEGIRGLRANGSCIFPTPLAMGATWDSELVERAAIIVGRDARYRGIRQVFAPVLDLGRDPRHGRTEETYGEDPFLAARLGVAFVKGLQSQDVIATPKHFVSNFVGEAGRDSGDVELSERALRELYFIPFKAAIREGGALGLMCAYNSLSGTPCALNRWLLTDVLRTEWNFQGIVVSDWGVIANSINDLHATATPGEAARRALSAGTDVETPKLDVFNGSLAEEVKTGRCKQETLDDAVRRVLRLKFRLGLFENRYNDGDKALRNADTDADRKTALLMAQRSIVLLKNEHSVLPLKPSIKSIAVVGPNADVVSQGGYTPEVFQALTPRQALLDHVGNRVEIHYAKGCELTGDNTDGFVEAIAAVNASEAAVLFLGGSRETAREEMDRADLDLTGTQEALIDALAILGKPIVVVLVAGGPVTMTRWISKVDAVLMAWYPGEEGGNAIAQILAGACNPSGHLPITFPQFTGQLPMPYNHRPYGRAGSTLEVPDVFDSVRYNPQFPFGHGLSYTTFAYSDLDIVPRQISREGTVRISVTVTNAGRADGEDVVQLYLSCSSCRITQPVKRLCAFQRISLAAGANQTVTFILGRNELAFLNEQLKPEVSIGSYSILAGSSSQDGLRASFEVAEVGHGDPFA
jgi:beta-glucosidase